MTSIWSANTEHRSRPALDCDIKTDVLVIGGGMCGILAAHFLKQAGVHCTLVEAKTIGGGVTQNTTAKITAQHGLIYADLIRRFGAGTARQYYDANTQAVQRYCALAAHFSCDLETKTAYVYSVDDRDKLEREARAYQKLGIPSKIEENPMLPFNTAGAIVMEEQAQFHPLKLLYALADGLEIYENTFVQRLKGDIAYTAGGKIKAKHIILATHYPLVNIPGLYFLKLYQHRSYVMALKNAPRLDGMYLDEREGGLSFRTYGDFFLIGGGSHKTGKKGGGYAELSNFIKRTYPNIEPQYQWATQDCMSLDSVPYIGRHRAGTKNLYVATGLNKWGMTGSMVAAELLSDLVLHGKSKWEALYNPHRPILSRQLFGNIGGAAAGLLSFGRPRCAHMGCKLHWNTAEQSWDCACHGSRFDCGGHVINNPAKKGIRL